LSSLLLKMLNLGQINKATSGEDELKREITDLREDK
jgi:hypothetical protein